MVIILVLFNLLQLTNVELKEAQVYEYQSSRSRNPWLTICTNAFGSVKFPRWVQKKFWERQHWGFLKGSRNFL